MKNILFILLASIGSFATAQGTYNVNAVDGLTVRSSVSGKKIGKIPYGYQLKVLEKSEPLTIKDNGKSIKGNWVKVDISTLPIFLDSNFKESYNPASVFVFDGYLIPHDEFINQVEKKIAKHPSLSEYYLATSYKNFAIKGDFFADGIEDDAFRMIAPNGDVRLIVINNKKDGSDVYGLGGPKDPFDFKNYDFEYLYKIPKNTPFWSKDLGNKTLNEVPKDQLMNLGYDVIFVNDNKSPGGYIYRMNKKWNVLK